MLRTVLVICCLIVGIRYSLKGPFYMLLFYLWLAYFRPEFWLWSDFLSPIKFSWFVGAGLLLGIIASRERPQLNSRYLLLSAFLLLDLASTLMSDRTQFIWTYWTEFGKVILVSCAILALVNSIERLRLTLAIMAVSMAIEGARQGWIGLLLHPGQLNANPLPSLGDNNGVAVGMLMLVPILVALTQTASNLWQRGAGAFFVVGTLYRAVSTYSRGGFLSLATLASHYFVRSKRKIRTLVVVTAGCLILIQVLPEAFWQRMQTIPTSANQDEISDDSITSRFHFWRVALQMARDRPLFGVGHNAYSLEYNRYDDLNGRFGRNRAVHSAWLGILAEIGFPGFFVFALIICTALRTTARVRALAQSRPSLTSLAHYGSAIEAGLWAFVIGGSFIPFQYTEMLWHYIALAFCVGLIASRDTRSHLINPKA